MDEHASHLMGGCVVEAPRLGFPQPTPQPFTYTCCFHAVIILMFPPVHALAAPQSITPLPCAG